MRRVLLLVLAAALLSAGCAARGAKPDYFGYTKKPVYSSTLDLATPGEQRFYVEDGSIGALVAYVWMNATSGGAHVDFVDPGHRVVWTATQTGTAHLPVDLGAWTLRVTPDAGAAGSVGVLVTRG